MKYAEIADEINKIGHELAKAESLVGWVGVRIAFDKLKELGQRIERLKEDVNTDYRGDGPKTFQYTDDAELFFSAFKRGCPCFIDTRPAGEQGGLSVHRVVMVTKSEAVTLTEVNKQMVVSFDDGKHQGELTGVFFAKGGWRFSFVEDAT